MTTNSIYVMDANILIDSYQRYYSFDIAPSFWRALKQNAEAGQVVSIDRIKDEINNFGDDDDLKTWVNSEFSGWFVSTDDEAVFQTYREVIGWATGQAQFTEAAKTEFASVGDSWLIACAKAHNYILVTHERFNADVKRRIPIPNVCRALGVPYVNQFEMLRRLRVQLG